MGDRTTALKYPHRRAHFDVLARVSRFPKGVMIQYRGRRYAYVRCAQCRDWYWRIYYVTGGGWPSGTPYASYCSDACSVARNAVLRAQRQKRWKLANPGYVAPSRRKGKSV